MLEWYKVFDRETFMKCFGSLEFRQFNPFYKIEQQNEEASRGQDASVLRVESLFDSSNSFSQMFYQFNLLLKEQIKIKQNQDPFAETCMAYCRQSCLLLTNQLMQAHLLVSENHSKYGNAIGGSNLNSSSTMTLMKSQPSEGHFAMELEQFKQHCMHMVHWGQAEQFYIFTVCNLVQTNDTTKFYRERVLMIGLRILFAEIYLLRNIIHGSSESLAANIEPIKGRFKYKQDLTEILLTKIRHYGLVNQLEFLTFQKIHELESNFLVTDKLIFDLDSFQEKFKRTFFKLLNQLRDEPVTMIKEELRLNRLDLDGALNTASQYSHTHTPMATTPSQKHGVMDQQNDLRKMYSVNNVDMEQELALRMTGASADQKSQYSPDETLNIRRMREDDDMSVKTTTTRIGKNGAGGKKNINGMKLFKSNVLKTTADIDGAVENDQAIDLEKIRKTFKNLINDQRFQQNYDKIKSGNPQLLNAKDRKNFEKRQQQVAHARNIFVTQVQKKPQFYLQKVLDNLRNHLDETSAHEKSSQTQGNDNDMEDHQAAEANFDTMMHKGAFRKKQGVLSNNQQAKFYYDGTSGDNNLPLDLVDHYLKEKHDITLSEHGATNTYNTGNKSAAKQGGATQPHRNQSSRESARGDDRQDSHTQSNLIESRAGILENPVYKKMPFYPYKDLLMWQEVEAQQCRDYSKKLNEIIYREVRNNYFVQMKEEIEKHLKLNPQISMDALDATNPTKMMAQIYGEPPIDKLLSDVHSRDGIQRPTVRHKRQPSPRQADKSSASLGDDQESKADPSLEMASFRRLADDLARKYTDKALFSKNEELSGMINFGGGVNSSVYGAGQTRPVASSLNSMKGSKVFSDIDTRIFESRVLEDDQIDQSMPSFNLSGDNETQQVINTNMQGVTPTQTQAFVESVASQFEKLLNLDQISDLKMSDGVAKRNKANPSKLVSGQGATAGNQKYQGVFSGTGGLTDLEQRDLITDKRPVRLRDVSPNN